MYFLEVFWVKYLYNDEEKMKIDLIELGFLNYLEFWYLINDLVLKNEYIVRFLKVEIFKEEFFEGLLKYKMFVFRRKFE